MNRIKELRQLNKWRQEDLAARLNVGKGTISRYENEQLGLDVDTIHALCDLFGCTADYLLCRSSSPSRSISKQDAALIEAYHAADDNIRKAIDALLFPAVEPEGESAVS